MAKRYIRIEMLVGFLCILFGVLCLSLNNRKLNYLGLFSFLVGFSFVAAVRPETSADTPNYYQYYEYSKWITNYSFSLGRTYYAWVENWYLNFCSIFAKSGISFRTFLFLISFSINTISIVALYKMTTLVVRNDISLLDLTILYMSNYGFLYSYVVIRGGLSLAFGLLGVYFFQKKCYIRTIIFVLFSVALHNYSLVVLAILFLFVLYPKHISYKTYFICFLVLILMAILRVDVLFTNYIVNNLLSFLEKISSFSFSHYLHNATGADGVKKGTLLLLLQSLYITYLYKNDIEEKKDVSKYLFIILIGGILSVVLNNNATVRMSNYFTVYQIILFIKYISEGSRFDVDNNGVVNCKLFFLRKFVICVLFPVLNFIYILRYCSVM